MDTKWGSSLTLYLYCQSNFALKKLKCFGIFENYYVTKKQKKKTSYAPNYGWQLLFNKDDFGTKVDMSLNQPANKKRVKLYVFNLKTAITYHYLFLCL